jgi:phenylacetate-CoA ligase
MGMSSYGIHLANMADARGIDLAANPVKLIMCSAEAISEAKRTKIEHMWGARLHDNFGMTEAGMMGSELGTSDGFRIWSDMFFVEVVDPSSGKAVPEGEEGLLVVTPLWTNNATPFLRWNSGDIVTYRSKARGTGPFSIFPVVRHAHRTAGFFKVRGVNINHSEFEDFMFGFEQVVDFKAEILTENDLDTLRVSVDLIRAADWHEIAERIGEATKNTFEVRPEVALLDRGTLAAEFEGSVKAPRFVDRRD